MLGVRLSLAFAFKLVERLLVKILGLVISVVLARLLEPETFGLLAIISVFINLANTFMLSGFSTALVQKRSVDHKDYSTVFYTTTGIAVVLILLIYYTAPFISRTYEAPELVIPLRVMAFSLIPGSLNAVQNAKLQRELRFKEMMICNLISTIIAGIIGIAIAIFRPSIWALVVYQCGNTVFLALVMIPVCGWWPKFEYSISRAKEFFSFGSRILVSSIICSLYADIRSLIIGHRYSTADLAHYSKAQQFPETIAYTVDSSMSSVLLAAMAALQGEVEKMHSLLLKTVRTSIYLVVPMMFGLSAVSETFIPLLLTDKWNKCIPLMQYFCFANLTLPISTAGLCYIKACGRSDVYLRTEIVRRTIMICILMITVFCFDSVEAIATGYAMSAWLDTLIIVFAAKYCGGPSAISYFETTWKTYCSGFAMFLIVLLLNKLNFPLMPKLGLQVFCGICIYVSFSFMLGDETAIDTYEQVKNILGVKK